MPTNVTHKLAIAMSIGALCLFATSRAEAFDGEINPGAPDHPEPEAASRPPPPQPWLYLDDPTTPKAMTVVAHMRATYSNSRPDYEPFTFDIGHRGGVLEAGADVGLLPWLALTATGYGSGSDGTAGAYGGARVSFFPRNSPTHLVASAGFSRDLASNAGVWGSVAFEEDVGRARVGTTIRMSHTFAPGRDAADITATAGASYGITGPLRAGVEWIGTDLEGAVDHDEAEGGIRHFAGPSASMELLDRRLTAVLGPAFGLSRGSPPVVGRMSIAYAF